ncbi:MAG: GGDEF domain-containing protein [Syntrophales bacterium]
MDTRTILVIIAISCLIMSTALFVTHVGRFRRDGMRLWTVGYAIQFLGATLIAALGTIPDFFSIVLANTLLSAGYSLIYAAVREFQGRPCRRSRLVALTVCFFLVVASLQSAVYRIAFSGMVFCLQTGAIALILFREAPAHERRSRWLSGSAFAVGAVLLLNGGLAVLLGPPEQVSRLAVSPFLTFSLLAAFVVIVLSSFGFLLMTRERANRENERLATLDPLTEIFNRRTFLDLAQKEVARHRRTQHPLALLMVDFDHFKRINDTHGHLVGDAVLKSFTETTLACLRRNDIFGRYGGEEFAVLLPDTDAEGAAIFAERLRTLTAEASVRAGAALVRCAISIDVTGLSFTEMADLDDILRIADEALFAAKNAGRNRVVSLPMGGAAVTSVAKGTPGTWPRSGTAVNPAGLSRPD